MESVKKGMNNDGLTMLQINQLTMRDSVYDPFAQPTDIQKFLSVEYTFDKFYYPDDSGTSIHVFELSNKLRIQ